ncbi:5-methyltetrahydropteroyltriglutamate--homocysteine S-methyltransferase [Salinithrix halophila]|uniref:5-methyltetrahydropteroyltriglutamate--homocysteine methyltransferase n=1 Tax=Salinithrix halophila TaxID=1485204 RepID=A0ABV8JE66_9BACL
MKIESSNLGFPRIGAEREWKRVLEDFWAGKTEEKDFLPAMKRIRLEHIKKQADAGVNRVPVGDFTLYDHVLDTAVMFGLIPERFQHREGPVSLNTYFSMARGAEGKAACEMTKWFNTNYHYIVPEWGEAEPVLTENKPLTAWREAKEELGIEGKPVLLGPYTFAKLSKGFKPADLPGVLKKLVPLYAKVLRELEDAGVEWVQVDEPALVLTHPHGEMEAVEEVYQELARSVSGVRIMLQTYFGSIEHYQDVARLPVAGIGLDFQAGREGNLHSLRRFGFPENKVMGVGILDGRNIWRGDLPQELDFLEGELRSLGACSGWWIQPSCSLIHVPVSVGKEEELPPVLKRALSFAEEKLEETTLLTRALCERKEMVEEGLQAARDALHGLARSELRTRPEVREAVRQVTELDTWRDTPYPERRRIQQERFRLPLFPTTTIGSLPQTREVRGARLKWRRGDWSDARYREFVKKEIADWIHIQEELDLDVLVHGEFERTDMVEYFGEKLDGFAFTRYGWVQSYGSRCVKPPILFGDVEFREAMTVEEVVYAQSLTSRPVKGMLTGPVTILNWSFVRDDLPRQEVARQVALALKAEVKALEAAGIGMIQMDEPALREGLPLKSEEQKTYLDWAISSFRLAVSGTVAETQVHTHMCYSDFHDILEAIREMDADVISIETSRSHGELIEAFETHTYDKGIGLGVYDIHSPRVPPVEEMAESVRRALRVLEPSLFWINPDCGLKTRTRDEVVPALRNMVEAARHLREEQRLKVHG